jgi:ankyrin repeat protein
MADEGAIEAIHVAASEGHAEDVARMLDEDPALLSSEWEGETLLTQAAERGRVGVVTLLLERGADANIPTDHGDAALHLAAHQGHVEVVSILLGSGADVFRRGAASFTPLIYASSSGSVAVVQLVLRYMGGRGLDDRDNGYTALWDACDGGHVGMLCALLLAGAGHTIADIFGRTPRQIAQSKDFQATVDVIQVNTVFIVTSITCTASRCCSCCAYAVGNRTLIDLLSLCLHSGGRASCSVPMSSTRPGRYTKSLPRTSKPLQPQCPPT